MLDEEDLFTRAPIERTIEKMDRILEPGAVDVDEPRTTLANHWSSGFASGSGR